MASLQQYLQDKTAALAATRASIESDSSKAIVRLQVVSEASNGGGARTIQVRQHHLVSDSRAALGGYDNGPSSPELLLGSFASCLAHTYLLQAAVMKLPIESVAVEASADLDLRGTVGIEGAPPALAAIHYETRLKSSAPEAALRELRQRVEETCPVLNALRQPMKVVGETKFAP